VRALALALALCCWVAMPALADGHCGPTGEKRLFWGDLHVHTTYSLDAWIFGAARTPDDAYAFARGAPERLRDGREIALDRPLDFAAVTDHAEYFGFGGICARNGEDFPLCEEFSAGRAADPLALMRDRFAVAVGEGDPLCPDGAERCRAVARGLWQDVQRAAHDAYEPCAFTTFVGSEWTQGPGNEHWHRNLIYRTEAVPAEAVTAMEAPTQEQLWAALEARCLPEEGCEVLAIPHNSNLGLGGTFLASADVRDRERRARFERLAEITQHKGTSECFPGALASDEACDFEITLPIDIGRRLRAGGDAITDAERARIEAGYLRAALGEGLRGEAETGLNPYRYGFVGSTDTHGARPGYVDELGWQGAFGFDATPAGRAVVPHYSPGGLVAVWAEENTREAVFDALARREAYATSGPRIGLRFAQSFEKDPVACIADDAVPMGGSFRPRDDRAPTFSVQVRKDGAPIVAVDIIRLRWLNGELEQNIETFEHEGATEWCVHWIDEDVQVDAPTLWYARVREAATPRWSSESGDERLIQERAWSSPIWSGR